MKTILAGPVSAKLFARRIRKHVERLANATYAPLFNELYARLALGISKSHLAGLTIKTIGGYRVAYRPGTSDEEVLEHSFDNDIFFSGVPEYRPKAGDHILDVGAHLGDFSLLAARRVAPGMVHAVEPARATHDLLQLNLALNRAATVRAHRLALGARDGHCTLYHSPPGEDWGNSTTHDHGESGETVPCLRLSSFFAEHAIDRLAFAKLNCEGGEFAIILDAPPDVLRQVRIFLVLYHCDFAPGRSEQELVAKLEEAGFLTTIRERENDRGWLIAWQAGSETR